MKIKYFASASVMIMAISFATLVSCSDEDDYSIATGDVVTTVETGDAAVTAKSAITTGRVLDLTKQNSASYSIGVVYSTNPDPTTAGTKATGSIDSVGVVTTNLSALTKGITYYYATYVTLEGKVTKYGDVKSFVATDAKIATGGATGITTTKATITAQTTGLDGIMVEGTTEMHYGFKISSSELNVQKGVDYPITATSNNISQVLTGLIPGMTYYYTSYFQLGDGLVYGDTKSFKAEKQNMEYVDLGLSVLWAKCNIGAEEEQETGVLVGYGDKTGLNQSEYLIDYSPAGDIFGTENDIVNAADIDGNAIMNSTMPTKAQMDELIAGTTQEAKTVNGVAGIVFKAKNGNSIFMPYTGYRNASIVNGAGTEGLYWTGSNYSIATDYSNTLKLSAGNATSGLSKRSLGLAIRPVRLSPVIKPNSDKLIVGDIESNGNLRIELYNQYGSSAKDPSINPSQVKFSKNMVVTFKITGIKDNLKPSAAASHIAGLEYGDADWSPSHFSKFTGDKYDANVTGDGTYTVWMETSSAAEGATVFCVDIANLSNDLLDPSQVKVEVENIKFDVDPSFEMNYSNTVFINKDGKGTDGRIEIYNEYGSTKTAGTNASALSFVGNMIVNFTISGIDGNLIGGASKSYLTELSYADADWSPSYWGGSTFGRTTVTGDGTYTVFASINGDAKGAIVWTIELYNLWKELSDPSKVKVHINSVIVPGKN